VFGTGFCGAFTTISTFTFEAVSLYEADRKGAAVRDIAATILAGGVAAALGIAVTAL
jgi:CrcB protein